MKRLIAVLAVLALAFYVAWPAAALISVRTALEDKDEIELTRRIDFDAVRASMRPAITAKVETVLDEAAGDSGSAAAQIYKALKTQVMPRIVDAALTGVVTPAALIRIYAERGTLKEVLNRIVGLEVAKTGGAAGGIGKSERLTGDSDAVADAAGSGTSAKAASGAVKRPRIDWRNIKSVGLDGPGQLFVKFAKNAASSEPDLTVRMTFRDFGWVLTGIEPRL